MDTKIYKTTIRNYFISGPYRDCPSCKKIKMFGVFMSVSGSNSYKRECKLCHYEETFKLPKINKKIVYLDQFVISNLIKLLDSDHSSHKKIINGPLGKFWKDLFVALEKASKSQAIVCPDSFYHKDEASIGNVDFRLTKRLYEHFSGGKTLYPSTIIERSQIQKHFDNWLKGNKTIFTFNPNEIAFGSDLNEWQIGIGILFGGSRLPNEIEGLKKVNATTQKQLADIWVSWKGDKSSFEAKVKQEVLCLGKGMDKVIQNYIQRKNIATQKMMTDPSYQIDVNDIFPPPAMELMEELVNTARENNTPEKDLLPTVFKYLDDANALLEVPYLKISSIMFAGLSRSASLGEKKPPKSTVDVQFISSYLPYCDAMFVDIQSARILRELPSDTPKHLRLDEYNTRIFTLNQKEEFLEYLESVVSELPAEQVQVLQDVEGEDFTKPYWSIIEEEKNDIL